MRGVRLARDARFRGPQLACMWHPHHAAHHHCTAFQRWWAEPSREGMVARLPGPGGRSRTPLLLLARSAASPLDARWVGDARRPLSLSAFAAARPRKDAASVAQPAPNEEASKPRLRRRANAKTTAEEDVATVSDHHDTVTEPKKTRTKTKTKRAAKAPTEDAAADTKTATADKKVKASKKAKVEVKVADELAGEEVAGSGTPPKKVKNARKGGEKAPTTATGGEVEKPKKAIRKKSSTLDTMAAAADADANSDADADADTDADTGAAQHGTEKITRSARELRHSPGEIGHINDGGNEAAGALEDLDEAGRLGDELQLNDKQIAAVELAIGIPERKVKAALRLRLVEGNTVPFIARYRQVSSSSSSPSSSIHGG